MIDINVRVYKLSKSFNLLLRCSLKPGLEQNMNFIKINLIFHVPIRYIALSRGPPLFNIYKRKKNTMFVLTIVIKTI